MNIVSDAISPDRPVRIAPPRSVPDWLSRVTLALGALLGLLTVAAGALSAHLPDRLLASGGREMLRSAVQMQGWHVAALLATGLLMQRPASPRRAAALTLAALCFVIGLAGFCTGVDALAFAGGTDWAQALAHLAPVGGTVLMLGWLLLAVGCLLR